MNGKFYRLSGQLTRTLLWSVLVLWALPALGQDGLLLLHGWERDEGRLRVEYSLERLFDNEIRDAIDSGLPATLVLRWHLWQHREIWPDKRMTEDRIYYRIIYDVLEDKYDIFDHRGRQVIHTQDLLEVEETLCGRQTLIVPLPSGLKRKHLYFVKLEVSLEPLPSDQIRNLEGWLSGDRDTSDEGSLLSGASRFTEKMLKRMAGMESRKALARTQLFQGDR
ncbi:MAG: DUF4390 domain-containing protein [bacterium]|nr:DUF4390 domain-containing protein [bacterium]